MAFVITCSSCSAKLKCGSQFPIGRSINCPKCKSSISVDDDNMIEIEDNRSGSSGELSAKSKPARNDNDRDEISDKRKDKSRAERSSRTRRDDDDETDDDDLPARRREEGTTRPRKKKNRRRKKEGKLLMKIGLSAVAILALCGIAFLVYSLLGRPGDPGSARDSGASEDVSDNDSGVYDSEMMAYFPADTRHLTAYDFNVLLKNQYAKTDLGGSYASDTIYFLPRKMGVALDGISHFYEGVGKSSGNVYAFRFTTEINLAKLTGGPVLTVNGKSYYRLLLGFGSKSVVNYVHFPSAKLAVQTSKQETMKEILSKNSGTISIPEDLHGLAKSVGGAALWDLYQSESPISGTAKSFAHSYRTTATSVNVKHIQLFANAADAARHYDRAKSETANSESNIDRLPNVDVDKRQAWKDALRTLRFKRKDNLVIATSSMSTKPFENIKNSFGFFQFCEVLQ